jgi:hypothetical protein
MVQDCAPSRRRLHLLLAVCLSLACGKVTTPNLQGPTDQRDTDDRTGGEQPPPSMPNGPRVDAGTAPDQNAPMGCDANLVAGLSITVGSPDFECDDLRVFATAADFEEELACSLRGDRCRCFGVHERPGTYRVSVETGNPPVELIAREVDVAMDDANCHVETETLALRVTLPDDDADAGASDAGGDDDPPDPPADGGT